MPIINKNRAVHPAVLADPASGWRQMLRIESVSDDIGDVIKAINAFLPERLVYAEGDSWFDRSTPLLSEGTNLLDAIRTPFLTAVIDVSRSGEEVRDMVRGPKERQTRAMFKLFGFQAILLSAGGNDLLNVFADLFESKARAAEGHDSAFQRKDFDRLNKPGSYTAFFADVVRDLGRFVDLRNAAGNPVTRTAPIFVHGYDYLQPRRTTAIPFSGTRMGRGPWLYPGMSAVGLSHAQMRSAVDEVVDELNRQLQHVLAPLHNVHVIDQRSVLHAAKPGSTGCSGDWLDEIHPSKEGFDKLARNRWDVPLSMALGWTPGASELAVGSQLFARTGT